MRRILALVCIFILLLFTGMPMFTSNLLCNQIEVYADESPNISDNEKIRAAITVFLNSKGAYLSSNGLTMNAVMGCMQENIDHFYPAYSLTIGQAYDAAALVLDIGVSTSPLTVVLKAGAVSFFNAFLQWLIDEGKITSGNSNDNLYNGLVYGNELFYYIKQTDPNTTVAVFDGQYINQGSPADGYTVNTLVGIAQSAATLQGKTMSFSSSAATSVSRDSVSFTSSTFTINYYSDVSVNESVKYDNYKNYSNNFSIESYCPYLKFGEYPSGLNGFLSCNVYNASGGYGIPCRFAYQNNAASKTYYGFVYFNVINSNYYFYILGTATRSSQPNIGSANVDFNKDDFDPSPTTPPAGSDGLSYQPRQSGTGNTYNTYNDYYQDWHEGDTYIYNPPSGGGGSGGDDPGSGGDDPTPGGTTPPWDGTDDPGTPGGTLTPVEGGGYNLNFPDLGLPDLNIDWSINGLKEKFPFSIPWDLMAFFAVMNAEPETPEIQATIPLGLWEWEIDWDLHQFDGLALILRNLEFIGFCIGLVVVTRSIIKG